MKSDISFIVPFIHSFFHELFLKGSLDLGCTIIHVNLRTPLTSALLKTTQVFIDALFEIDIKTVGDLLLHVPRTYEDLSEVSTLLDAPLNEKVTLRGVIRGLKLVRTRSGKKFVQAQFADESGDTAEIIWFNQPHVMRMLREEQPVTLTGKVQEAGYKLKIQSPSFEDATKSSTLHAGRIVAVYPQTEKISSRWLREKMPLVRPCISELGETLPEQVLAEEQVLPRAIAIEELHFPTTPERLDEAKERMAFEEMFSVQQDALERKNEWQGEAQKRLQISMDVQLIKAFFRCLHFTPTGGQKVAMYEILRDMEKDRPMSRLLEGDVGSGKTLVAVAVIANVLAHRAQCALMVPTEVLARQHSVTISKLLIQFHTYIQSRTYEKDGIDAKHLLSLPQPSVALLTGSMSAGEASDVRSRLAQGTVDLVIGTHALIEEKVKFKDLRLAIVDEQHRFGVGQRKRFVEKGSPHFLSMTATPIPRTLALTAYGDHDLSVLMEKPGNRKVIQTKVVSPTGRKTVELFIEKEIQAGRQTYVICPLVETSDADGMLEVKNVEAELERLKEAFPTRRVAKLHGRLSGQEKAQIMQDFKDKKSDILVSTSVIEVGIDVPNSTIIVIEGAERFGLSQLHQFRGRVGRSDHQSYCFLFTTTPQQSRSDRLKAMEQHDSGFMLAEIDLKLRGPGEVFGIRQSGIPDFRFGSLLNVDMVLRARKAAEKYLGLSSSRPIAV